MAIQNSNSIKLSTIPDKSNEQIKSTYKVIKDVYYGSDKEQNMDVYLSEEAPKLADKNFTILFLHGGAFYLSDKAQEEKYIQPYLHKGLNVVNMNYRLKRGIPIAIEDLTNALHYLEANKATYLLNLNKIILVGFSAGAHIASIVGLSANNSDYFNQLNKEIKFSGIINFSGLVDGLAVVEKGFMNHELQLMKDIGNSLFPFTEGYTPNKIITKYEPIIYFDKHDPPFFLWYGGKDDQIPPATFEVFVKLLQENKSKNEVIFSPESNHFPTSAERKYIYDRIFTFLDKL
ncbi:alpha/beta hydrolase [Adhaeribacter radiodurans]|uniref:Alpha/beta hydrolase n=1 Tax=Adhaeribacter radiodurans TaxID=2745197 RepID=A0A7L7LCX9_9BACT|nr:alpha/beta hydrolase [Adhaeribacter radiodurans]QMU30607.1 alpha/beta hydrolase [Adhaeribacter radiodurans]